MTYEQPRTWRRARVLAIILAIGSSILVSLAQAPGTMAATGFQKTLPLNPAELDDRKLAAALDLAQSAGVTQIQASATWWYLTRAGKRTYDWSYLDRLLNAAESRGMNVALQLQGTPDWVHPQLASSEPDFGDRVWHPPVRNSTELAHWTDFVKDIAGRYRGRVSHYEIWNEQNWSHFWKPATDVHEYARLLRAAHYGIGEADPAATVVFGGLAYNDVGFLSAYYDSVNQQWGDEGGREGYFFDVLGVHPYSEERSPRVNDPTYTHSGPYGQIDRNFMGIERLKQVMDSRDSVAKPVYIGEYGFSTTDTWMRAVPDGTRAEYLRDGYNLAASKDYVTGMAWYAFHPHNATGSEWAIVDHELNPSQTFEAMRSVPSGDVPTLVSHGENPAQQGQSPPAGAAGEPAGDPSRRPRVSVRRLGRLKYVATVRCGSNNCAARARGTVVAKGQQRRRFRIRTRTTATAGASATLEVKIPRRALAAASKALRRGGAANGIIAVTANDASGEAVIKKRPIPVSA